MKKISLIAFIAVVIIAFQYCHNGNTDAVLKNDDLKFQDSVLLSIKPVVLPDPKINGFNFPEDSNQINGWIKRDVTSSIALHGWGLWTALNMNSGQIYNGEQLRVFETWVTPDEIKEVTDNVNKDSTQKLSYEQLQIKRPPGRFSIPNQFIHAREMANHGLKSSMSKADSQIVGFVKYDPTAAAFLLRNKLLDNGVLSTMLKNNEGNIPSFPNTSIALKPVFKIIIRDSLKNGYYKLNVWNGIPSPAKAYPDTAWQTCVYVDPTNQSHGNGSVDPVKGERTSEATYNIDDFIYFKLDEQKAEELRAMNISAKSGDLAILVGMHVTSREISRWTWQTFWWTPDADKPPLPSSSFLASARPKELQGAQRHYAMSIAYTFISPDQPLTGGNNIGKSIYAFNPYLEAGFDPSTFYNKATVITSGKTVINQYGVQTNCMSCHALANFSINNPQAPGYMADTYIDLSGTRFKNSLRTDFLWSIPDNVSTEIANFKSNMKKVSP